MPRQRMPGKSLKQTGRAKPDETSGVSCSGNQSWNKPTVPDRTARYYRPSAKLDLLNLAGSGSIRRRHWLLNKDQILVMVRKRFRKTRMAKVTSKYQVTVPKKIAERYGILPGDDIDWVAAGEVIRVIPSAKQ